MADLSIIAGATSQSINVDLYILATGAAQTGLVFNSTGLKAYYSFTGATTTAVAITLATLATVTTAYSSGGFIEIDATNMPGLYRLDLPNAALAAAKGRQVVITITGFSGMATTHKFLELTGTDNQNAASGGMSNLDAAVSGRMATYTQPTGFLAATFPSGTVANTTNITAGTITTTTNLTNAGPDTSGTTTLLSRLTANLALSLDKTTAAIARGTVTTGGSTTSIPTSAFQIAGAAASGVVADEFKDRVVLFDGDTTTAGLRGATKTISASSASNTPTLTVGTLPATPASGDTFSVI